MKAIPQSAIRWMIGGRLGLLLLLGIYACDPGRPAPVGPADGPVQLRLRLVYDGATMERPSVRGKRLAAFQDPNDAYWRSHDPDDWSAWPDYAHQSWGLNETPEVDRALRIDGDQAKGTLRVQAGEKFLLVGSFEKGALKYIGTSQLTARPDHFNEAILVMSPWGDESHAVDEVKVQVYHVRDLALQAEAKEGLTADLPGGATMEFVWIEPGTFLMGSPDDDLDALEAEKPQHEVTLSQGFYLGKYEITQGQWQAVMGTRPWEGQVHVQPHPSHPAVFISWEDMQGFIDRLNEAAKEVLYRLPSEAEWEYACRAGTRTRWSFGDDESQLADYAWYGENAASVGLDGGQPVGTKLPNPWGLYDMHGNVLEWGQDRYGDYSIGPVVDPTGPSAGANRVVRGGDFNFSAIFTRSADRSQAVPSARSFLIGARLVRIR